LKPAIIDETGSAIKANLIGVQVRRRATPVREAGFTIANSGWRKLKKKCIGRFVYS